MATEADKTNTGIVITAFGVGTAAMIGGVAAIISMVRTEMNSLNDGESIRANHVAIAEMRKEQRAQLSAGKLPIDRAAAAVLADIQRDPFAASPATKLPASPPEAAPPPVETPEEAPPVGKGKTPKKSPSPTKAAAQKE